MVSGSAATSLMNVRAVKQLNAAVKCITAQPTYLEGVYNYMNQLEQRKVIGDKFKKARVKEGLSQNALSKLVGWTNAQFVSNCERGLSLYPPEALPKICAKLKLDILEVRKDYIKEFKLMFNKKTKLKFKKEK
jgi:DNA-binding XRE family transcriptional regulator